MTQYKRIVNRSFPEPQEITVWRLDDDTIIPLNPANTDYQQYLAWLAEGNEPLPADEPPTE